MDDNQNLRKPEDSQQPEENEIIINNLMVRRIGIAVKKPDSNVSQNQQDDLDVFVLPPFGKRSLKSEELDRLDYKPWEQLNLIKLKPKEEEVTVTLESLITAFGSLVFAMVIIAIPLSLLGWLLGFSTTHYLLYMSVIIIFIIGWILIKKFKAKLDESWENIKQWGAQSLSLLLILTTGIGLPALVIYFFGGVRELLNTQPSLALLGRGLQLVFIAIVSLLPALMYFLFTRHKLRTLKENFFQDIVHLDPRVITLDDAKSLYEGKINAVYGSEKFSSGRFLYDVRSPIFIATLVITMGWIFTLRPFGAAADNVYDNFLSHFFSPADTPIVFGFLGAYLIGLNMLFRRYVCVDLRPKAYTHITVRILGVIILVWVLSVIPWDKYIDTNGVYAAPLLLAFLVGIFPGMAIAIITEYLQTLKWIFNKKILRFKENDSLRNLEGINIYHRMQLLEEGIENIENLAHHDLIDLTLQTRIPLPCLVDWVDQAILHLHIAVTEEEDDEMTGKSLKTLRQYGIRTATDLEQAYEYAKNRQQEDALLEKLDGKPSSEAGDKIKRFQVILDTLKDDEWMAYIRSWRDARYFINKIFTIDEIKKELHSKVPKDKPLNLRPAIVVAPSSKSSQLSSTPAVSAQIQDGTAARI